jgi:ankyrin repeat protein
MSKTALIKAVRSLDMDTTRRLLTATPALRTVTDDRNRNLLHLACSAPTTPHDVTAALQVRLVEFLLEQGGFDIDQPVGPDACTPLFFAVARARNAALVDFLIDRGARPAAAPGGGLFAAGWWEDLDIMERLIAAGAPVDVVVGVTPFLACWIWKRFEAATFLALHGADVNARDEKGRTALHHGIEKAFAPDLLSWLVSQGASPDIEDSQGVSPRARAARKRNPRFLMALE